MSDKIGPQGPRGLKGEKGNTGASGVAGVQGPQGPRGLQGLTGLKGDRGEKGEKGDKGDTGATGPAGIPGADGAQGPKGIDGVDGQKGDQGDQGPQGPQGIPGNQGLQGPVGPSGIDGRYILGAYNSLTGIGNSDAIGDETLLFSQFISGNTLSQDGDELELFLNTEYFANDPVDLIFELNGANRYTYAYQNSDNDIRFIKIKIARIDARNQLWTIEDVVKTLVGPVLFVATIATNTTTFDLTTPMTFAIYADNSVLGANQVILKKAVVYLNKMN